MAPQIRPASFPKCERIRKRSEYLALQGQGRKVQSESFLAFGRRIPEERPGRLGVTVSKRVGTAVQRNRVKRLIREAYRRNKCLPPGADVVIVAKRTALSLDLRRAESELVRLLKRLFG